MLLACQSTFVAYSAPVLVRPRCAASGKGVEHFHRRKIDRRGQSVDIQRSCRRDSPKAIDPTARSPTGEDAVARGSGMRALDKSKLPTPNCPDCCRSADSCPERVLLSA
jgi:hypothetical protein